MSRHTKARAKVSMPNRIWEVLLTLGALAGLASIVIFIAGLVFGITPLIFQSGSMSPTIDTGALAFARTVPASEVQVGDILSVYDSQGTRITHRVESIDQQGNNLAVAQLRGDANPIADPDPYVITEADRVFFSINRLGYVAVWLSGPSGLVLGAIAVGGLLYIAFRPRKGPDEGEPRLDRHDAHGDSHAFKAIVALATVGLSVTGIANIGGTQAAFTGTATAGSISFTTAASFPKPPASMTCSDKGTSVLLAWPGVATDTFRIIVRNATNTTQPPLIRDVTGLSTTLTLSDLPSGGILLSNTNYDVELHGLVGTYVTPEYTGYRISSSTLLIILNDMACVSGPTSGTTAASAPAARSALVAQAPSATTTTSTAAVSSTTPSPTTTPSASTTLQATTTTSTTTPSTTTSSPTTTTAPPTTTTTTTTVPPITTTPSEVPIGAPATTTGLSAQKLSTASGNVVSVSNSSGTEVYRGAVDNDAVLHWLTGTDQLYVITTSGVTVIDTSTGVWAESPAPSELPDEIKALVP
ncbi:signal peptidase I [Rhodococcus sp. P-2]|uniref:signal peptidase I n=1 Tax=Rhodococcus sp. P-2 TaxID=2795031 RepID=UPI001905DC0E|nr:signal peptidase I [Rhodococcus sp. P-2]QQM21212.1 signal peptidase I [Rhodococcus sp. P-2]